MFANIQHKYKNQEIRLVLQRFIALAASEAMARVFIEHSGTSHEGEIRLSPFSKNLPQRIAVSWKETHTTVSVYDGLEMVLLDADFEFQLLMVCISCTGLSPQFKEKVKNFLGFFNPSDEKSDYYKPDVQWNINLGEDEEYLAKECGFVVE